MIKSRKVHIKSLKFENFKAFENYKLFITKTNILVGPNNSGKSTIIGALRALDSGLKTARSRPPSRIFYDETSSIGYRIPVDTLPISLENVHTNYNSYESTVTFSLSNGTALKLVFPKEGGCILIPEAPEVVITTAAIFKQYFPISLTVVPVLGPVEAREQRRERSTVVAALSTHRASRHFRSYWHYFDDGFAEFALLIEKTWPGMEIKKPELDVSSGEFSMFCLEERMTREIYWVGFGFQIWCQLLTHLSRAKDSSLIVIDEPEVYLHPDIQRQLLGIIRNTETDIILATHSSEIMSEADPNEIIIVDKKKNSGERLKDISGLQRALDVVGSAQNIALTALSRSRRVLFVEGDFDFQIIKRFAKRIGLEELGMGLGITALKSGGFGSWERVTTLASGIAEALGTPLIISAIYDRDYFCDEQILEMIQNLSKHIKPAHVHGRKEIENYMLIPNALDRALQRAISERLARNEVGITTDLPPNGMAAEILREITEHLGDNVQSQIMAQRGKYLVNKGKDLSTINKEAISWFKSKWKNLDSRLEIVSGKEVLSAFRTEIQKRFSISLTDRRIIDSMHQDDIAVDLKNLLIALNEFRTRTP